MGISGVDVNGLTLSPGEVDRIVRHLLDVPYRYAAPVIKILGEAKGAKNIPSAAETAPIGSIDGNN